MSNNKQIMKLYTKKDFLKAAEFCEVSMIDAKYIIERIDEVTDPIELPSDEEIYKEARRYENYTKGMDELSAVQSASRYHGFMEGAAYIINKIQGGNK